MRILLTGASGAVGSLLVPRLLADGHRVRALLRRPISDPRIAASMQAPPRAGAEGRQGRGAEIVLGDAISGDGLQAALEHVDVAYYLIHSMQRSADDHGIATFVERERRAAENFASAAQSSSLRRIVYLGGPVVYDRPLSRHLASRLAVERILGDSVSEMIALRASIVIGARSRSFRFMVRLIERLPVLALPPWRAYRTRPIDARDLTEILAACTTIAPAERALNVGGPDVLTYQQMMERIAELLLLDRPVLAIGAGGGQLGARLAAALAGEDPELVTALMESLAGDLLVEDDSVGRFAQVRLHSFDAAVEHALGEWERLEPLAAR